MAGRARPGLLASRLGPLSLYNYMVGRHASESTLDGMHPMQLRLPREATAEVELLHWESELANLVVDVEGHLWPVLRC